jgi:hypothetical protein
MAEKEYFLFFCGLMQKFEFRHAPGTTLPSYMDVFPETAVMRTAPEFQVVIKQRS